MNIWVNRNYFLDFGNWNGNNSFPNFGNGNGNDRLHPQLLGMGTGMKIAFPIFGNRNGNENIGSGNETSHFP